jgi:hypothetical protein
MNNYNWLQQKLHKLVLSSQYMRRLSFDIENSFIPSTYMTQKSDNHIFISGLARSGTTILLNALYESDQFASLTYQDMPFVLAPNLWSKSPLKNVNKNAGRIERAHGDGIKVSLDSPEALEEVFWITFNQKEDEIFEKFKTYINLINQKYKKNRYLSKNNQNIKRIELLSNSFPHSNILIPFRRPLQHAYSLLTQHKKFLNYSVNDKFISDYMKLTGHTEFGPAYKPICKEKIKFTNYLDINHWIEQWYLVYGSAFDNFKNTNNVSFICYENLCKSNEYWLKIQEMLNINNTTDFAFKDSQKKIEIDFDQTIYNKAKMLYRQLIETI